MKRNIFSFGSNYTFTLIILTISFFFISSNIFGQRLRFYGASDDSDELYLLNPEEQQTTLIGSFGVSDIETITINPNTNILYDINGNQLFATQNDGFRSHLIIINISDGSTVDLGRFNYDGNNIDDVEAMSALPNGRLFITASNGEYTYDETVFEVDITDPSNLALVGQFTSGEDFEGLAAFSVPVTDTDGDGINDSTDLDIDNDGITNDTEGCENDQLVIDSSLNGTTTIGVSATVTIPNGSYEKLSDGEPGYEGEYFDNPNFTFAGGLTSLPDGLQINFSSSQLSSLPNSGDGDPFEFDFGTNSNVLEVYLHVNSVDQFRIVFKVTNNLNNNLI